MNAIELLPVQEFNEMEYYSPIGDTGRYRTNFWGYSTMSYFAPMSRYGSSGEHSSMGMWGRILLDASSFGITCWLNYHDPDPLVQSRRSCRLRQQAQHQRVNPRN